jgi:cell division protease FtsH
MLNNRLFLSLENQNPFGRKYYEQYLKKNNNKIEKPFVMKKYPLTSPHFMNKIKRLNSRNYKIQNNGILGNFNETLDEDDNLFIIDEIELEIENENEENENEENENEENEENEDDPQNILEKLFKNNGFFQIQFEDNSQNNKGEGYFGEDKQTGRRRFYESPNTKSQNFQVITNHNILFKDVGGYNNVKEELSQCVDILKNYKKYIQYNVRIPKGLILEGPPGTGKTLLSKALAGEANCSFIPVSGSDFQEKYVGIGSSRIKELFELAKKNVPCIIFIDEIDALGRKRSSDGESSSSERDNTLNSLLVELDGFKDNTGVFLVAATNRIDLLDSALIRPGRIDKKIYIGLPDSKTREAILNIHIKGKPYCDKIGIQELVEITEGFTGAQIENLLNEAMLNALRVNKTQFNFKDFDLVLNKMMVGWQPNEHEFTSNIIDRIAIHEMGHAVIGLLSKHHSKVTKVVINLSSPKSPGYTVFEGSTSNIYIREALFEHLMILLGGRIAEEVFYGVSVTTGAINDFEEALKLAEKMILYYGMGRNLIYPSLSEKYKEEIDKEVAGLINDAYKCALIIIQKSKEFIYETSEILKTDKLIKSETLNELIETKYNKLKDIVKETS